VIEGHCSDEGSEQINLKLSQKRAEAVRDFLAKQDLPAKMFKVIGFGKTRPIASNETTAGRERNRRVEFIIEGE
jgi:OmpA-OmpF porin, OOP family